MDGWMDGVISVMGGEMVYIDVLYTVYMSWMYNYDGRGLRSTHAGGTGAYHGGWNRWEDTPWARVDVLSGVGGVGDVVGVLCVWSI